MAHLLHSIPFFSELSDPVLDEISKRLQREHYHKGTTIFQQEEPGDCMYFIETGQVKVVSEENGGERILAFLGPGNFFGEMALLLGEKRSATVRVVIDCTLLILHKDDFEELVHQHPNIPLTITRELSRRLGRSNREPVQREEYNIIATFGTATPRLARFLARLTGEHVFIFDLGGLANVTLNREALARERVYLSAVNEPIDAESLPTRLGKLVEQYYWVLLALAPYETPMTIKAMDLADVTVEIAAAPSAWVKRVAPRNYWFAEPNDKSINRLARKIAQRIVGIALSSGNARGLAHVGVLQVLEEEGIEIDMIAGTSAGAVFGALYAAGCSIEDLRRFAVTIQHQYNFLTGYRFWDFRIPPRSGVIRGDAVLKYFREWLDNKSFDDLDIPMYIVAADLISGEEVVFDRGPVAEAVRASTSVIGMLEPAYVAGRFLIDGGAVNPVPSLLLADRGVNIVIASNVIPSLQDRLHRQELRREGRAPNMIGIVTGAMEIMESEIIRTRMGAVDILIQPDTARYGTMEYDKVTEIIQRGEEAARRQIPPLLQLLSPRPRPPLID